ncbi:MAG: UbiA family prenyltransferase [Deltaproteobacteria bacterium]|nr:UbiA family prenyltransferase [Deltaproteobacteria bacterium]
MDFKQFSSLIMIEQTLFALPFALIGVLFAGSGTLMTWIWAITALVAARTAGMSFNRVIDADIDARNPRTRERLIPKGEVQPAAVWLTAVISSIVLIEASYLLNELCFHLSFVAVFLLFTYSYFKRFSASSHFYLGFVEAAAPIGGYLAVTGEFSLVPFVLGFAILTWIAGLDIVYALQDKTFDEKEKLHSVPVRMGGENALAISAICYLFSISAMIYAGILTQRKMAYWVALVLIGAIFFFQQKLARDDNISASIKRFFKINMYISPILFFGTLIDVIMS